MGGTSYSWTVMQEGPNDCMVDIMWTLINRTLKLGSRSVFSLSAL